MRTFKSLIGLCSVSLVAGCGSADAGAPEAVVRDSAGVRIVENAGPLWPAAEGWRLSAEPQVTIGALDGAEPYLLAQVRQGFRRGDGSILIANGATAELRLYDADGRFIVAAGREGGGPGEFTNGFSMNLLRWPGDSVGVWDLQARRLTIFDPAGAMAREAKLVLGERVFPRPLGFLGRDELAVEESVGFGRPGTAGSQSTDSVRYSRYSLVDEALTEIQRLPRARRYSMEWQGRQSIMPVPFGAVAQGAVSNDRLYYSDAVRREVVAFGRDGVLQQIARQPGEPKPLTQQIIDGLIQRRMAFAPEEEEGQQAWRDFFRDAPWPETLPAYQGMRTDAMGNVWVMAYRPDPGDRSEWFVFDPRGQWLSTLVFPPRFEPMDIGADYVLGRWLDDLDVEYVHLYGLVKPVEVTAR